MDTSAPPDELAARAVAAYQATAAENVAGLAQRTEHEHARMFARATETADRTFDTPEAMTVSIEQLDGRDTAVVDVAGVRLAAEPLPRLALRGLVACPRCGETDRRTAHLIDSLARLGQLVAAPASFDVLEHETGADLCDGNQQRPAHPPRYVVTPVLHLHEIAWAMNDLDQRGYNPSVIYTQGRQHILVVGQLTNRWQRHGDDDPF